MEKRDFSEQLMITKLKIKDYLLSSREIKAREFFKAVAAAVLIPTLMWLEVIRVLKILLHKAKEALPHTQIKES